VALAHRQAVLGDDVAEQLQALLLAHVQDDRHEPVGVLRLDRELALEAGIEQVLTTFCTPVHKP